MEAFLDEFQHLQHLNLKEIKSITNDFDENNIIGEGGFGKVYKGVLSHSMGEKTVDFKRLGNNCGQGNPEFLKEILMLSRYKHENLISLLGFCDEDGEKILVYECASHGSLDRHLSSTTLTWKQRLKICLGAATRLCYLHDPNGTQQRVIHRDIKSSNILIDENWNAKVSDLGLSKIGAANQPHTFLVTNVVGTFGYIDPTYMETSILTKESDVYSFGVVLFEVLCGRLCFEYTNGIFQTLVRMWKKSYKEKKLEEITFQDLKQHMDPSSLEIFSDIAYGCLHKSSERRPKMSDVVEKLEIALRFQEDFEEVEPEMDYVEMSKNAVPPLVYRSKEELKMLLSKGIFVNGGKTWFWLNKSGQHCETISASECLTPIDFEYLIEPDLNRLKKSRFGDTNKLLYRKFRTHVKTQFLSPHITYTVNLVFHFRQISSDYIGVNYILAGETKASTSYVSDKREDGWLMAELYQFTTDSNVDLEITFECQNPMAVEGIEFQPLDRAEHQVSEDAEMDMQTISESDTTYWEQKLPSDYEDIVKRSKDSLQWTTKKELYSILCKGFLIDHGEEWFSLAKNGKKCHMMPPSLAFRKYEWRWQSLLESSRFGEVAFHPEGRFSLSFHSRMLPAQTTYATYLVYRLQESNSSFEPPLKVRILYSLGRYDPWYIYLVSPRTPIIRSKFYQATHNPLNRPKMKGLPQQRNDGWMEVQIWEFCTGATSERIRKDLDFAIFGHKTLKGLIVQGIEYRPI